jgi:hypothetical protein
VATNVFFNNYGASQEQYLIEDLIIESIKMYGQDVYYINRTLGAEDRILREDDLPTFDAAYQMEMYIKNIDGFEGDGDFLSKFGLEIRDEITFTLARRIFEQEVTLNETKNNPYVGDLIYFPLNNKIFEIKFVEHESIFYQMGALQVYDIRCDLFEYSGEKFSTGITDIDTKFNQIVFTSNDAIANVESVDTLARNFSIESEADGIIDFSEADPFSEGGRW